MIKGFILSYEAAQKKQRKQRLTVIDPQLALLEKQYREALSSSLLKDMFKLKHDYNSILSQQISTLLLKVRHKQFELGDKPGPLLSRQLWGVG